jgi:pyruvate/2-oxoglutarate dehydrogenase complex dihydrolipoamide acyltransferase (E2) component
MMQAAPPAGEDNKVQATPAARKLAKENGVDLASVRPPGDVIGREDVQAFLENRSAPQEL